MQIWRMNADGTHAEQLTHDDTNDRFPHISPDGKQMVYLSCARTLAGQPANTDVSLRLMGLRSGQSRVLVDLFGGEGTINAPSWSPDNHHLAFTGYEMLPASADGPEFVMVAPRPAHHRNKSPQPRCSASAEPQRGVAKGTPVKGWTMKMKAMACGMMMMFLADALCGQQRPRIISVSHLSIYTTDQVKTESFFGA